MGPNTFVPIAWLCKKQGAVSHSTVEAEVILFNAGIRMEGLPALYLWDIVIDLFDPKDPNKIPQTIGLKKPEIGKDKMLEVFGSIDYVPPSLPNRPGFAKFYALEDNDAVIKMTVKQRSPTMRHVSRTHRVDLDWLFERISKDPGIFVKYVPTKEQIADILTEGSFTAEAWNVLCKLCVIQPASSYKQLAAQPTTA